FETKSSRVKGTAFHPKRPWILASLHNGSIQLWDYRMGTLLERFDEHEGPVRGISFHPTQELFVSGGDDYKVKVWNYRTRRCIFTLQGHLDYVRTAYFHPEQPWIITASDDQTIRIWNWQSRQCIAVLTGHNHYVMCAQFHPTEDLVVSACLDQTVRVWDISGLRRKNAAGAPPVDPFSAQRANAQGDFFNVTDVVVKFVLEGHTRGVNWATFHPTMPLILSCGDDRQVKIWRMNDSRAWEVDTCRGHYHNVNSALFHPKREFILSDSEDKTIRIWDTTRRTLLQTFRRDQDRFWCLNAHPELNLFAAGHDNGLIVFKLERERPAAAVYQKSLIYVKDSQVLYDSNPIASIRTAPAGQYLPPPRTLSYNPTEQAVLLTSDNEGGTYELYIGGKTHRGSGKCAIWVGRNRFAVLDNTDVVIKDLANTTTKTIKLPVPVEAIFNAPGSQILLATATSVQLFDVQTRQVVAEINAAPVKYIAWSADMSSVALLCKHTITLATSQLEQMCQIHETIRIKSATWDASGVLLYTTLNHIKFALPNGDSGVIRTIDNPVYLVRVAGGEVHCLDREADVKVIKIDPTEYQFKLALLQHNHDKVVAIIRNSNLVGQSIIAYLQKTGYPEIALHFVRDDTARFELALECGDMDIALETAKAIDKPAYWHKFSQEALSRGYIGMVEQAYQRTKAYDKLSFLYSITGNLEKLGKMHKIATMRNHMGSRLQTSLLLGDVEDRVQALADSGQSALAYLTAKSHGLADKAEAIREAAGMDGADTGESHTLLVPTMPVTSLVDWPQLQTTKRTFKLDEPSENYNVAETLETDEIFGDRTVAPAPAAADIETGWDIDDAELQIDVELQNDAEFMPPQPGSSGAPNSQNAVEQIAAGNFERAIQLLNKQKGISSFATLKPMFMDIYTGSQSVLTAQSILPNQSAQMYSMASALEKLQQGYDATTNAQFADALHIFRQLLLSLIFISDDDTDEVLAVCREYILGISMELERAAITDNPARLVELAAYFTHCQLRTDHEKLSLRLAMTTAYKHKCFKAAGEFAQRLLDLAPAPQVADKARKLITICDRQSRDSLEINYDAQKPLVICAASHTPIYQGEAAANCPYCQASYKPEYRGNLCHICTVAKI
ncbi:hypothetical protein LPJ68_005922, partial [Coemansia sp. RSA 1086]